MPRSALGGYPVLGFLKQKTLLSRAARVGGTKGRGTDALLPRPPCGSAQGGHAEPSHAPPHPHRDPRSVPSRPLYSHRVRGDRRTRSLTGSVS
jgi:hypothetical protein